MVKIDITDNSGDVTPDAVEAAAEQAVKASESRAKKIAVNEVEHEAEVIEVNEAEELPSTLDNEKKIDETIILDEEGEPLSEDIEASTEGTDNQLDKVIDEVIVEDGDELLDQQDEAAAPIPDAPKRSLWQKTRHAISAWWANKLLRNSTLAGLAILIAALVLTPVTRYFMLNLVGVRVSASLSVADEQTSQPLKNVQVSIAGKTVTTNSEGKAEFSGLKLGDTEIAVEKRAFATVKKPHTLGWGSNPLGEVKLKATGAIFNFEVRDWLSDKALEKVEASSGEFSALSNKEGKIALVLDATTSEQGIIKLIAQGYRTEEIPISSAVGNKQQVELVLAKKHAFISKRSGKYDLYSIDLDGKNEKLLLAGTGLEKDSLVLAVDPKNNQAALVSSREDKRNKDGFLLNGLYIVDLSNGSLNKVTQSERIQVVDWYGDHLVYVQITEGVSATNSRRHRLVTYNVRQDTKTELASSNYFNDVLSAGGKVFYAPSNAYQENSSAAKLFMVNPDGKEKRTILGQEVWNIIRTDYKKLSLATQQNWYNYQIGDSGAVQASGAPSSAKSKIFFDNQDSSQSIWLDERDGKGVIVVRNNKSSQEKVLITLSGLNSPAYWAGNSQIVFRISTAGETADYIVSIDGGEVQKITDVSSTSGIDSWYFY